MSCGVMQLWHITQNIPQVKANLMTSQAILKHDTTAR